MKIHLRSFGRRHQEIQLTSTLLRVARTEVLLAVTRAFSPACWVPSHHQLLKTLPLSHIWWTCSNTESVSYTVPNLSVTEGFCTLCALQEYSGDLLLYFFLLGSPPIHQWPSVGLPHCTILRYFYPTNSMSCEGYILPVFRANLKIFSESGWDTLFHFCSTCSEQITYKKINHSCHGFSCGWAACDGIQHSIICIMCFCSHTQFI